MPPKTSEAEVFVLWFRPGIGHWREVFRGSKAECSAEFDRRVKAETKSDAGSYYTAPLGRRP